MDEEQKRISIGEAEGFTKIRICTTEDLWESTGGLGGSELEGCVGSLIGFDPELDDFLPLPDYLNDLNAICGALKNIKQLDPIEYTDELLEVVNENSKFRAERGAFKHTNASAEQRCEALLRVLKKN